MDIFLRFPARIGLLVRHFFNFSFYFSNTTLYGIRLRLPGRILLWLGELQFLLLDLAGIPEWYEMGSQWLKPRSRPLTAQELGWARSIFGETLPYHRIRIDEGAHIGPRQYRFCYVSFCVINSWQAMLPAILMHELVHVWQFQRFGSPYILRALLAQRSMAGYDYGGLDYLSRAQSHQLGFLPFNYEQQASIIEDYFRLQQLGTGRWEKAATGPNLETYRYFVASLQAP